MEMRKLVGENFARLRAASGLTQEQVAERANVSQQYVSGLERGERNPTIETLQAIASALGVSHVELVRPIDQAGSLTEPPPESSTKE
ncbi:MULTISPECIES: helix-turn-helix domain-containing protein [unclassified Mesorhizobium]|uniref:helix-turn-helix domain-containing protein n=1 Tax=unclassified Mesorhizobium TaxID=325217 RepID=UPI001CCD0EA5|nr:MULTISPECIES: helix-turn-helix transcriptional regulator [unclassified Mesorhizobium]MBZ9679618.1 helix-turn-helix domain-containing protein [Mesorhizobium sp. CO1-1-2]MBZ9925025.1 helix-turn-helix domain-containing protein [Mesorhizobium sp. BR1-1-4]